MTCDAGRYADARDYTQLICTKTSGIQQEPEINKRLERVSGMISAALQASDQCDCTWAAWAENYLATLNVYLAAALQDCPCSTVSDADKDRYLQYVNAELEKVRLGQIELCAGATGKDYPAFGTANIGHNIFSKADIIQKRWQREGG